MAKSIEVGRRLMVAKGWELTANGGVSGGDYNTLKSDNIMSA